MRSQITHLLLAAALLALAASPGMAQTGGYAPYSIPRPTYVEVVRPGGYDYYVPRPGFYRGYAAYPVPVPASIYRGSRYTPAWMAPAPSITSTVARSRFMPSAGMALSTRPPTWSHTSGWPQSFR